VFTNLISGENPSDLLQKTGAIFLPAPTFASRPAEPLESAEGRGFQRFHWSTLDLGKKNPWKMVGR